MKIPIYSEGGKLLAERDPELNTLEIIRKGTLSIIRFFDDGTYKVKDVPKRKVS